jgi:hypothetical protein
MVFRVFCGFFFLESLMKEALFLLFCGGRRGDILFANKNHCFKSLKLFIYIMENIFTKII